MKDLEVKGNHNFILANGCLSHNSVIFYDEAGLKLIARRAMSKENVEMMYDLAIRRHKGWSIVYATQHTSFSDISIMRMASCFFWKRLSWEEANKSERNRTTDYLLKFIDSMMPNAKSDNLFFDGEKWYMFTNTLPTFWTENLSKGFCLMERKAALALAEKMLERKEVNYVFKYVHVRCPEIMKDDITELAKNRKS